MLALQLALSPTVQLLLVRACLPCFQLVVTGVLACIVQPSMMFVIEFGTCVSIVTAWQTPCLEKPLLTGHDICLPTAVPLAG